MSKPKGSGGARAPVQTVVQYAAQVGREIEQSFADAPLAELGIWVRLAHQREAMVTQLYQLSHVEARLGELAAKGPAGVVRSAVLSIWAHEESHTRFLSTIRGTTQITARFTELQGHIEGRITRAALSGNLLARALIALGASLDRVPEFATEFGRMNLHDLLLFQGELETTARTGYERILALLAKLSEDTRAEHDFGYTFAYDIARILCEERFHEDVFSMMPRWLGPDGETFADMAPSECARILHDLAERNLSLRVAREVQHPALVVVKGDEDESLWVSDGGLGTLFEMHGLHTPVACAELAMAELRA